MSHLCPPQNLPRHPSAHLTVVGLLRALVMQPDIPDAQAIERILRYEPMLHANSTERWTSSKRLQRRRQGEAVPPPVNANLSVERQ